MIMVFMSLSIECLVAVSQLMHKEPAFLPQAAMIRVAAAGLLIAWEFFLRQNILVKELETEAMAVVKSEDNKVE